MWECRNAFGFGADVRVTGAKALVFLGPAAGPFDDGAIYLVVLAEAKRQRQFRLRQVARSGLHHLRLLGVVVKDADRGANRVAIRFRADQAEANAVITRLQIVAEKAGWAVVGRHQKIDIAVAVKIRITQSAAHAGAAKIRADFGGDILK